MCGIFGVAVKEGVAITRSECEALLTKLFILSESRGKESAGLHLFLPLSGEAWTLKGAIPAAEFIHTEQYKKILNGALGKTFPENSPHTREPFIAFAHSRLVTNGKAELPENNQPVRWGDVTVIHNGIVVNVEQLWKEHPHLTRHAEVDTEFLAATIATSMGRCFDPILATRSAFSLMKGSASIAWVHGQSTNLTVATNTGDLYIGNARSGGALVFASEQFILSEALKAIKLDAQISPLPPGKGICLDVTNKASMVNFDIRLAGVPSGEPNSSRIPSAAQHDAQVSAATRLTTLVRTADESLLRYNENTLRALKRCSCCVLPETFPFIEFDEKGVCNYCKRYKTKYKGLSPEKSKRDFLTSIEKYRQTNGRADVIVPFSGGRDSCYGLHLIKREFGFTPITFSYDWGMVTDLARRNIARFCGQLGIQNILVSADIKTKRANIRRNVSAWLKKPDLGMVPLFMAGDKYFFKVVNDLKKQTGIALNLWSGNPLENTDFKVGLCGIKPDFDKKLIDALPLSKKIALFNYYMRRYVENPAYLNQSLVDTFKGFLSYYVEKREDYFAMFNHIVWDEKEVESTIIGTYDFERSPDSPSTWRIGDGVAPFYNYIYVTANGFSEFDTFRSNQIREGLLDRETALELVIKENYPRTESLRWFLDVIGVDFNSTIKVINTLDKRHLHISGDTKHSHAM
jgi:glucosamine--fructose-6-phosphate aminotransferase (isomerizing)